MKAAEQAGDERTLALTLASVAIMETVSAVEPTPGLLERAVALEDAGPTLDAYASPSRRLGLRLMCEGRLDEARDRLTRALARAVGFGDEVIQAYLLVDLTEVEHRAGNWPVAARHAADGYELAAQYGFENLMSALLYARALIDAHLGQVERARPRPSGVSPSRRPAGTSSIGSPSPSWVSSSSRWGMPRPRIGS